MQDNKPGIIRAAGAGRWFPGDARDLNAIITACMRDAEVPVFSERIVAAISPHAGYVYSGPVAGHVFRVLRDQTGRGQAPETVVVLGFSHSRAFAGVAVMDGEAVATPLGTTPLDREAGAILTGAATEIFLDNRPHQGEHSAENQVPFIQAALPDAKLALLIIGDHAPRTRAALVAALLRLQEHRSIMVVASSDMLHDPGYEKVARTDRATLDKIAAMRVDDLLHDWQPLHQTCCGIAPVAAAMEFAARQGCQKGTVLHYRNSGDDHPESRGQWVVGYAAVVFGVAPDSGRQA